MNWKKTFDIRIRSDNVIGRRHRWRHRTLSLTFLLEYVHRLWVWDYFIVYIFTLVADLGSLNRCYSNLKWNHLLWIISKNVVKRIWLLILTQYYKYGPLDVSLGLVRSKYGGPISMPGTIHERKQLLLSPFQ